MHVSVEVSHIVGQEKDLEDIKQALKEVPQHHRLLPDYVVENVRQSPRRGTVNVF